MDLRAGETVDRYVVEELLGRGGMAEVWRARHIELGTFVALKRLVIPRTDLADRLLREGRMQASLRHPNVLRVHDVVRADGAVVLVLDYVRGQGLDAYMFERPLTLDQIDDLARGLLAGVAAAHAAGMVHRDLKPANVLLDTSSGVVVPRVADFGLARAMDDNSGTRAGVSMGTPGYMPPEQLRDARSVDARADVFALGALLYELVCGRVPYDAIDLITLFEAMSEGRRRPVRELRPDAPDRMVEAIELALAPDREGRPQDAQALLAVWVGQPATPAPLGAWSDEDIQRLRGPEVERPASSPAPRVSSTLSPSVITGRSPFPVAAVAVLVALILGALVVVAGLAIAVAMWPTEPPVAVAVPAEPAPPEPMPVVEVAPAAPAAPAVVEPVPPPPVVRAPPAVIAPPREVVVVQAAPPPDPPAVVTPAPPPAGVTVAGVDRAVFIDASGRPHPPGALAPGPYTLTVYFDAVTPTEVLKFEVVAGESRVFRCLAAARSCR